MLYFIATIGILLIIGVGQYFAFIRLHYINSALYKFHEIRFQATNYLIDNVKAEGNLDKVIEVKKFADLLNRQLNNFDKLAIHLSRFQACKAIYYHIVSSSTSMLKRKEEGNAVLENFKEQYCEAVETCFKAIPFFKIRFLIDLTRMVFQVLVKLGFIKFKAKLMRLNKVLSAERRLHEQSCFS